MAYEIISNKKYLSFAVFANSNTTLTIAGNNSVSNVAIDDEVLTGASIKQVFFGSQNGSCWIVKRGANVVGVYESASWQDYAGNGVMNTKDKDATLVLELVGSANGYMIIEMQKHGNKVPLP